MPATFKLPPPRKLREFGLTAEQYRLLWGGGLCPICLKRYTVGGQRTAVIDHDHHTFETRGVICSADNYWLGCMHDDADKLARASSYLILPPTAAWHPVPRIADAPPRQGD